MTAVVACLGAAIWPSPLLAAPPETIRLGAVAGADWQVLRQPSDASGQPTLMRGTGFDGIGGSLGASLAVDFTPFERLDRLRTGVRFDALYGLHRARGAQRARDASAERIALLRTQALHGSVLGRLGWQTAAGTVELEAGAELMHGLASDARLELRGADGDPRDLQTTAVTHVPLLGSIGFAFETASRIRIPIHLRAAWDPAVGASTVERFRDFQSATDPGRYEVAFDWRIGLHAGVSWELGR